MIRRRLIIDGRRLVSSRLADIADEEQEDGEECQGQVNGIVYPVYVWQEARHIQVSGG